LQTATHSHTRTHTHRRWCAATTEAGPLEATPPTCNISGGSSSNSGINPMQQQHSARANLTNQPTIATASSTNNYNNHLNNTNIAHTTNNTNNCTTLKRGHLGNRERERERCQVTAATAATTTALATTITTTSRNAKAATTTTTLAITGNSSYGRHIEKAKQKQLSHHTRQ